MSIAVPDIAATEIKNTVNQKVLDNENVHLRVGVTGGRCSGFSYLPDLTELHGERDEVMGRGFVFNNPNANATRGCASSFSG